MLELLMFAAGWWHRRKLVGAIAAAVVLIGDMAVVLSIFFEDQPFRWDAPGLWETTVKATGATVVYGTVFYIFGYSGRTVRDRSRGRRAPLPKQ